MNVHRYHAGIGFRVNQDGLKPALKKVPTPFMLKVQIDRKSGINEMHDTREVSQRSFEGEVIVIRHKAIDLENGGEPFLRFPQELKEIEPVVIG